MTTQNQIEAAISCRLDENSYHSKMSISGSETHFFMKIFNGVFNKIFV